jgi:HSP20 family protein
MHPELIESMREQACTIYRAATGSDISEAQLVTPDSEAPLEEVTRSFAELEALIRAIPSLAERVPPFSFTPLLDVIIEDEELLVEVAVPGTERKDISVECENGTLVISGVRRAQRAGQRTYSHGEIPRGPFYRSFHVPFSVTGEPAVALERGLLRVRLKRFPEEQQKEKEQKEQKEQKENVTSSSPQEHTENLIQKEEGEYGTGNPRSSAAQSSDSGRDAGSS